MGEGSAFRDYRGVEGAVEDAQKGAPDEGRKLPRGRVGASRGKSPRPGVRYVDPESAREGSEGEKEYGVRYVDPESAREGSEGEKEYGAPTTPPPVQEGESDKRKQARPDPLKKK
jgi:hypothetical protein